MIKENLIIFGDRGAQLLQSELKINNLTEANFWT